MQVTKLLIKLRCSMQITELDEYYPFKTELAMLQKHAADIITHIPTGAVVVELGCGNAQKTAALQDALLLRYRAKFMEASALPDWSKFYLHFLETLRLAAHSQI